MLQLKVAQFFQTTTEQFYIKLIDFKIAQQVAEYMLQFKSCPIFANYDTAVFALN